MTGETLNYKRHLAIPFGQYFQIREEKTPLNSTRPLTGGAICMGTSRNKQGGFNFMTLGSMKKVARRIWDAIPTPDTMIARANALGQGIPNDLDFLDCKKRLIGDLNITGVDDEETEAPHIELIEPETDLDPISAGAETLTELVERQDIPIIEQEEEMVIAKEYETLEAEEKIIDPSVTSLAEVELPVTISPAMIATPEETPVVHRYYQVKFHTNQTTFLVFQARSTKL